MESGVLTFILVSSFAVCSARTGITGWDDVVVTREGMPITLICEDTMGKGAMEVNWMVKPLGAAEKLVLTASKSKMFFGAAMKASMRLTDLNFKDTGVFSLFLLPQMEDSGLYSCLIQQQERIMEKRILLAILTVIVAPAAPILQHSTLRLIASVKPDIAISKITWIAPDGTSMKSEKKPNTGTVAKLPWVKTSDAGAYICMVWTWGNSSSPFFAFNVDVTVDANNVASFTNVTHEEPMISTATKALTSFVLTCPDVQGDYVRLFWKLPDSRSRNDGRQVYEYDRWRGSTTPFKNNKRFKLAGPPYNAEAGSFSFRLAPGLNEGGIYTCDVFLNDSAFRRRTRLTVLKVKTSHFSSKLELGCLYTERSQVQSAKWTHENKSRQLRLMSNGPGSITTIVPIPITSDTAGEYTCILQLTNGKTVWATQAVALPKEESVGVITPSLHPSLSALLLLVPLVAAAVGVLLWRQKHISDRSIEQSLSVHSGEAENVYENLEDVRQAPPEGSVYMDLKPREEDDVYKELEW